MIQSFCSKGNAVDRGDWWATYSPCGHKQSDMTEHLSTPTYNEGICQYTYLDEY